MEDRTPPSSSYEGLSSPWGKKKERYASWEGEGEMKHLKWKALKTERPFAYRVLQTNEKRAVV